MRDVRVEKCCCFNLETGVTILGVIDLVFGILSIIGGGAIVGKQGGAGSVNLLFGSKFKIIFTINFINSNNCMHTENSV